MSGIAWASLRGVGDTERFSLSTPYVQHGRLYTVNGDWWYWSMSLELHGGVTDDMHVVGLHLSGGPERGRERARHVCEQQYQRGVRHMQQLVSGR